MLTVGSRIRIARKNKKFTQDELAKKLGWKWGQSIIYAFENGRRAAGWKKIEEIAAVLGVSPAWLQYGEDIEKLPDTMLNEDDKTLLASTAMKRRTVAVTPFCEVHEPKADRGMRHRLSIPFPMTAMFCPTDTVVVSQHEGRQMELPRNKADSIFMGDYLIIEPKVKPSQGDLVVFRHNVVAEDDSSTIEINTIAEYVPPIPRYLRLVGTIIGVYKALK